MALFNTQNAILMAFFCIISLSKTTAFSMEEYLTSEYIESEAARNVGSKISSIIDSYDLKSALRMRDRCPRSLLFAFECECHFARGGFITLDPFMVPTCDESAEAIRLNPRLGRKIARACRRFDDIRDTYSVATSILLENEIFSRCPRTRKLLCPANENFKVIQCMCFLTFQGIVENIVRPQFCLTDFASLPRRELRALRRRCVQTRKFKNHLGAFLGTLGRVCIVLGDKNCCSALPPPPSRPPSPSPSPVIV